MYILYCFYTLSRGLFTPVVDISVRDALSLLVMLDDNLKTVTVNVLNASPLLIRDVEIYPIKALLQDECRKDQPGYQLVWRSVWKDRAHLSTFVTIKDANESVLLVLRNS